MYRSSVVWQIAVDHKRASLTRPPYLYRERVIKETIVNAVIRRDYRLRLQRRHLRAHFEDRIKEESPGVLLGDITPADIALMGSKPRNPLVATNLR